MSGCQDYYYDYIYVEDTTVVSCYAKFSKSKSGLKVNFFDESTGSPTHYYWDFGDMGYSNVQNPVHTYSSGGYYDVYLSIYDSVSGCQDYYYDYIYVEDTTVVSCYAKFSKSKSGLKVDFFDKSTGSPTHYYWDFGDNGYSNAKNPVHIYSSGGYYDVYLSIYDSVSGCQDYYYDYIYIEDTTIANCYAQFSRSIDSLTVYFFNESSGNISDYYWDFGDGKYSNEANPVHTYKNEGFYDIYLSIYDSVKGCQDYYYDYIYIDVIEDVSISCNAEFSKVVKGNRVYFSNKSTGSITNYFWEFGNGDYSNEKNPIHTFENNGYYDVYLSIYDSLTGCQDSYLKNIYVYDSTKTALNAFFDYFNKPLTSKVSFSDKSSGNITNWYWTFGDGNYTEEQNPDHIYNNPGFYKVCLIVYDSETGNLSEKCSEIRVSGQECESKANFSYFINPQSKKVKLSDKSTGDITNWFWTFGDGATSSSQHPTHTYAKAGYYLISLAIQDTLLGCRDYYSNLVQIGSVDCHAEFGYKVDATDKSVIFTNKSSGDVSNYYWYFGDGSYSDEQNPEKQYGNAGKYWVGLTISSDLCADYIIKEIQVGKIECSADFDVYVDSIGNRAYFTSKALGSATDYLWRFGDGDFSEKQNPVHHYISPGYYTVGLNTYNENNNCMDYHEKLIVISSMGIDIQADFYYQVNAVTKEVKFFDNSIGENLQYYWNFGDGTSSTGKEPGHIYAEGDFYNVCLTITDNNDMQNTECKLVKVVPGSGNDCLSEFIYSVDSTTKTVTFRDISQGEPDNWLWNFGNDMESTEQNPVHTYDTAGYYTVKLAIHNSLNNCVSRSWEIINVSKKYEGIRASFGYTEEESEFKSSGYPVDFIGVSTGSAAKYSWDFGDGSPLETTTTSPSHVYTSAGTYNACLTVTDPVTQQTDVFCQSITVGGGVNGLITHKSLIYLNVYPNPFNNKMVIEFKLPYAADVELTLLDELGRTVETILDAQKIKGEYNIQWDSQQLKKGMYILKYADSEGNIQFTSVIKL